MTSFGCLVLLLPILLLHHAYGEQPELMFRAKGSVIEMGYCFGVDYIVVYRISDEGDQLLGNSSANNPPITPPADLHNRIRINQHHHLLGLQIVNLTEEDSKSYRRECWQNQKLVSKVTQQLIVCDAEMESKEIIVKENSDKAELQCNITSTTLEKTFVLWYYEKYPLYKLTLFLDSSYSLELQDKELQGVVEVRDEGTLLVLDNRVLKSIQHFHCLVVTTMTCLTFQNMYVPEHPENRDIFATPGDRVVLQCPSDGDQQQWETPLGNLHGDSTKLNDMYISVGDDLKDFSLIIPAVTDEHIGDYSCISSSLELQYLLVLCPKRNPQEMIGVESKNVSLECKVSQTESQRGYWYRKEASGEYHILIHDPNNNNGLNPADRDRRVTVSENGTWLTIANAVMQDAGVYWCVVLRGLVTLGPGDDYEYDYDDEDTEANENGADQYWQTTDRCVFKQETILKIHQPAAVEPRPRNPGFTPTDEPVPSSNTALYAGVAAGVVLLLVAAGIAAVIVKKRKSREQEKNKDKNIKGDPDCDKRLTSE